MIDCEFTCWEESLRTRWSDPTRPPELIEIALVEYRVHTEEVGESFTSLVRPRLNPRLTEYCKNLTHISQEDVDTAPRLPHVLHEVAAWLSAHDRPKAPVGEWGRGDLPFIAADARRHDHVSPLADAGHISLQALYEQVLSRDAFGDGERDTIRHRFGLAENQQRHRALFDALDLIPFCVHLKRFAAGA